MPFASGGKLKARTSHSIAYFRAEVYKERKEHGKLKLLSTQALLERFGRER